jgi:crossover junction endodeoxyribonuclease RuvC
VKQPNPLILGVDPGFKGGIAIYDLKLEMIIAVAAMPLTKMGNGDKDWINGEALADLIEPYALDLEYAVIEQPSAMPGQGVTGMFRFGYTCGIIHGVVAAFNCPIAFVKPSVWKCALNLDRDKNKAREFASLKFPYMASHWKRAKDDGLAEAAILAWFGATKLK